MQKSWFTKFILSTTALSFSFAITLPYNAKASGLAPASFDAMYNLAKNGNVQALRASVRRGLNIDVMNSDGDTGLCIAARNNDHFTYNTFRAAGANPQHPCVQNLENYEDFLSSSKTVSIDATPREAFSAVGLENFHFQPNWWLIGGVALAGGAAAVALSGGGGGGKSSGSGGGSSEEQHQEEYNSLASKLATNGSVLYSADAVSQTNNTKVDVNNSNTSQIDTIDFTKSVLDNTGYVNVGFKAVNGGTYTNNSNGIIYLTSGAVGMSALSNSQANNNGFIHADSYNGTIGMVGSQKSTITNNASGIINDNNDSKGIDLNFSGKSGTDTVIGMYVDTNSQAINNGDIRGTAIQAYTPTTTTASAASTSIVGNIIGMEAMILNAGNDIMGKEIILTNGNKGNINISAGDGGSGTTVNINSVGMGSFLDNGFLNGSKNINRAEVVTINNKGNISINYTGTYSPTSDTTLRKGTGGIVGIRADANTTATNSGNISFNFSQYGSTGGSTTGSGIALASAMQSIHGASLLNNGTISIIGNAGNNISTYGMLSVEGSGSVSGLYTNTKQVLQNEGTIQVEASNSYGMASYNGGSLINNNSIIIGKDLSEAVAPGADTLYINNIGMYGSGDSTLVKLTNNGTIDVFSYKSYAMKNDFSGGQEIRNDNTINIHSSATSSKVFGGYYSKAVNNGTINYDLVEEGAPDDRGTAADPFDKFNLNVKASVMTSKSSAESSSSTTETIYNNAYKNITLNGSSFTSAMSVETMRGQAENNGTITLNKSTYDSESNAVGMYADSSTISAASIINLGTIKTDFYMSAAMASASTQNANVINNGTIETKKDYSLGMFSNGKSIMKNMKTININSNNSVAMYTSGASDLVNDSGDDDNRAVINIGSSDKSVSSSYAMYSKGDYSFIKNNGIINIYSDSDALFSSGTNSKVYNDYEINGSVGTGIHTTGEGVEVVNSNIIDGANNYGIYTEGASTSISNTSDGIIGSESSKPTYGIYASGANSTISSGGTIYASNTGIYATDTANISSKNIYGASLYGIYLGGANSSATNNGSIGTESNKPMYGIYTEADGATITNSDSIYASYAGVSATGTYSKITNSGQIYSNTYGIYANAAGTDESSRTTITNTLGAVIGSETIKPNYGIYVTIPSEDSKITVINDGTIYARTAGIFLEYQYEIPEIEEIEETVTVKDEDGNETTTTTVTYDSSARDEVLAKEAKNRTISEGTIIVNAGGKTFDYSHLVSSGLMSFSAPQVYLFNTGLYSVGTSLNFNDPKVEYVIGKNGSYQAPSLSGNISLADDVVSSGFANEYTVEKAFVGTNKGIVLNNNLYMFENSLRENSTGSLDAVSTMRDFSELVKNQSLAQYLAFNYQQQNNESLYSALKTTHNAASFDAILNKKFALDFIPNLAKQNLDNTRIIERETNEDLLETTYMPERSVIKAIAYQKDVDGKHEVSGYKDKVEAAYGFRDYYLGYNLRGGYGVSVTRSDSDFDNDSSRYNNVIQTFIPFVWHIDDASALLKAKAGFGRGHYRRMGGTSPNKLQTKEYYYGLDSDIRYNYNFGSITITPHIGFNTTGMYMDNGNESNGGLKLKDENVVSAQSVIGLDIKKRFEFDYNQAVELNAGANYYHEFGNKYRQSAAMDGMSGVYEIADSRLQRNFGLLNLKANYEYEQFSLGFSANAPLEQKNNEYYMLNLGYKF